MAATGLRSLGVPIRLPILESQRRAIGRDRPRRLADRSGTIQSRMARGAGRVDSDNGEQRKKGSKRRRAEQRRRAARLRKWRRRSIGFGWVLLILLAPTLWAFDRAGPDEIVQAVVIRTSPWTHFTKNGSHPHQRATLMLEGRTEKVIQKADNYTRGQRVPVWIRRGRLSGWPYFENLVKPGETEPLTP